jgi:hypothetical protein
MCLGYILSLLGIASIAVWAFFNPIAFISSSQWWVLVAVTVGLHLLFRLFYHGQETNKLSRVISPGPYTVFVILTFLTIVAGLVTIVLAFVLVGWKGGVALILTQSAWVTMSGVDYLVLIRLWSEPMKLDI